MADLQLVDPGRGAVMSQLHQLSATKQAILADDSLSEDEKAEKVSSRKTSSRLACAGFVNQKRGKKIPSFIKQKVASSSAFFV
jgi:hypothetical protein